MFDSLRSFWVKKMKECNLCCCIYHVEWEELRVGFNYMHQKFELHIDFQCEAICASIKDSSIGCMGSHGIYLGLTTFWEVIVCPKNPHFKWHAQDYVFGKCENCGVENLAICLIEEEESSSALISQKNFNMETIVIKKGEERKKLKLIYKSIKSNELIAYLKPKLQYLVRDNFITRWYDQQFQNCFENFPNDTIVSVIDFATNYSFEIQNKVQSMHWHNYQITILVHITWRRNLNVILDDEDSKTMMRYHFIIYDDKSHDNYFVEHCLLLHWEDIVKNGFTPKAHWIWFDDFSSQFNSKIPLYFVSRYPHLTNVFLCM